MTRECSKPPALLDHIEALERLLDGVGYALERAEYALAKREGEI